MKTGSARSKEKAAPAPEKKGSAGPGAKSTRDEDCRCKETAQMTPRELLERMMQDLAFWKKGKK